MLKLNFCCCQFLDTTLVEGIALGESVSEGCRRVSLDLYLIVVSTIATIII